MEDQLTPNSTTGSVRVRPRTSRACNVCRARKVKCDGNLPCRKCAQSRIDCIYPGGVKSRSDGTKRPIAPKPTQQRKEPSEAGTDQATQPNTRTYDDPVTNKKQQELRAGIGAFDRNTDAYQFYGPSSHFSFVQRLYQRIRRQSNAPLNVLPQLPEGLRQWGIERQIFTHGDEKSSQKSTIPDGSFLPKELGEAFISAYFTLMHPQGPILIECEVRQTWNVMWTGPGLAPEHSKKFAKEKAILYMVLAIGARLTDYGDASPSSSDEWAHHFYERAGVPTDSFEETSLLGTHLLLMRALYGMQIGRPNMVYLYLGHASRSAMALGLHRAQVVAGNNSFLNRLRLTFWTIFYMERMMSMFTGRPSCFLDDLIDAPYPDDFPQSDGGGQNIEFAYIRAMAVLGKISERIMVGNYSPTRAKRVADLTEVNRVNGECSQALRDLLDTLPSYLHFFDDKTPTGEAWQEVQRSCLGATYHVACILINRPALVYVTFFDSKQQAQESIGDRIDIQRDINLTVSSAKDLISLVHDSFFNRCPAMRRDGNMVYFIVSACLVLLFDVLDTETTPAHAREVFQAVEKGLKCLDRIDHIGSTTGRAISLDVMKIAKDALKSTEPTSHLGSNLMESFTWLNNEMFDQSPYDAAGSWLYNSLEMPSFDYSTVGMTDLFSSNGVDLAGPSDSNQMVLDVMGQGLEVADGSYIPSQSVPQGLL
ncbi:hypothetical protein D6D17_02637 [Aureobasidium pullulans]|nr:hypothetical protein D6D17_02637 [Aureobasidium pullulans]